MNNLARYRVLFLAAHITRSYCEKYVPKFFFCIRWLDNSDRARGVNDRLKAQESFCRSSIRGCKELCVLCFSIRWLIMLSHARSVNEQLLALHGALFAHAQIQRLLFSCAQRRTQSMVSFLRQKDPGCFFRGAHSVFFSKVGSGSGSI